MKKLTCAALFALLTTAMNVSANPAVNQQFGFGGFSGPNMGTHTVKSVKSSGFFGLFNDDMPVVLTGHITHALGGEMYAFSDGTDSITVEIDHELWFGMNITPQNKVMIYGEVDNDVIRTTIDVDSIRPIS